MSTTMTLLVRSFWRRRGLRVWPFLRTDVVLNIPRTMQYFIKVKCTLVQALRLCTGRTAHGGSRGIALPFLDNGTRRRWGVSVTPRPLFPSRERHGTHCAEGWVGPRAGLDRCEKSHPHWNSIPGPSSPKQVAIPTTLPGPRCST
jgi:hypothetical protein